MSAPERAEKDLIKTGKMFNACSLGKIWNTHQNIVLTEKKSKCKNMFDQNRELFYYHLEIPKW